MIYFDVISRKSDALAEFRRLAKAWVLGPHSVVRSDNAKEFGADEERHHGPWRDFEASLQIVHEYSIPYRPQSNARAERAVQTVLQLIRLNLDASALTGEFWPFAGHVGVFNYNASYAVPRNAWTPYEARYSRKYNHPIVPFGALGFAKHTSLNLPESFHGVFDKIKATSIPCVMLGYGGDHSFQVGVKASDDGELVFRRTCDVQWSKTYAFESSVRDLNTVIHPSVQFLDGELHPSLDSDLSHWVSCDKCEKWRVVPRDIALFYGSSHRAFECAFLRNCECDTPESDTPDSVFEHVNSDQISPVAVPRFIEPPDLDGGVSDVPVVLLTRAVPIKSALRGEHGDKAGPIAAIAEEFAKIEKYATYSEGEIEWSDLPDDATLCYSHTILSLKHIEKESHEWVWKARLVVDGQAEFDVRTWAVTQSQDMWSPVTALYIVRCVVFHAFGR